MAQSALPVIARTQPPCKWRSKLESQEAHPNSVNMSEQDVTTSAMKQPINAGLPWQWEGDGEGGAFVVVGWQQTKSGEKKLARIRK